MSISFSGVGSGLPVSDWITALMQIERQPVDRYYTQKDAAETQKSTLNSIEAKFSSLRSSIEKLTDANIVSSFDLFKRKTATSSDTSIATVTASNNTPAQEINLKVNSLATATVAKGVTHPGSNVDGSTKIVDLGNGAGEGGTFTIFVNNEAHTFDIEQDDPDTTAAEHEDTIDELITKINDELGSLGVTASITDGKFKLDVDNGIVTDFRVGATSDTSNFANITQLTNFALNPGSATPDNIDYVESKNTLSNIYTQGTLVGNGANLNTEVTAGTFTIGTAEFTINSGTTLSDLIAAINRDEDAGVVANFDARTNSFSLVAKDPGAKSINIQAGTSNFTEVMGLTSGSQLAAGSQTMGNNAQIELNDETIEVSSNTVTSDISGIPGLTINLLGTTSDTEGETNSVDVTISQDTDQVTSAVKDFITKFNAVINEIDTQTGSSGTLKSEYSLSSLRNNLKYLATNSVSGLDRYNSFSSIGITTGAVGTSTSSSTNNLILDSSKFLEALAEDPSQVKALLIGDSSQGITGIFQQLESKVESALDVENGYFAARDDSFDNKISLLEKSITAGEDRLEQIQTRLTKQFSLMDQLISKMQSQSSALSML